VAVLLDSLNLLMHSAGIKAGWRVIQGAPDFFGVTKKMHHALQGGEINWTRRKAQVYVNFIFRTYREPPGRLQPGDHPRSPAAPDDRALQEERPMDLALPRRALPPRSIALELLADRP